MPGAHVHAWSAFWRRRNRAGTAEGGSCPHVERGGSIDAGHRRISNQVSPLPLQDERSASSQIGCHSGVDRNVDSSTSASINSLSLVSDHLSLNSRGASIRPSPRQEKGLAAYRDAVMFKIAYAYGLRFNELCHFQTVDFTREPTGSDPAAFTD